MPKLTLRYNHRIEYPVENRSEIKMLVANSTYKTQQDILTVAQSFIALY